MWGTAPASSMGRCEVPGMSNGRDEFRMLSAVCGGNAASASGWSAGAEGDTAAHLAEHDVVGQPLQR